MKTSALLFILSLLAMAHSASVAWGHAWYAEQRRQDGVTGSCCGGNDCSAVPDEAVQRQPDGSYTITLFVGQHPQVRANEYGAGPAVYHFNGEPKLSPDGKTHVCLIDPFGADGLYSKRRVLCVFIGGIT